MQTPAIARGYIIIEDISAKNIDDKTIVATTVTTYVSNKSKISIEDIFSWGDDYQLVFTANKKFRNQISNLGKTNNIRLINIGRVIKDKGIYDDSMNIIKNPSSYDHFS